jgi:hypothetical protein
MKMDYNKWHDGIGYDLEALKEADMNEREAIEKILVNRNPLDWRDIEALAILDTQGSRSALKAALQGGNNEVSIHVIRFTPELVDDELKNNLIIKALRTADFYYGLRQTLELVEEYHPEKVIDTLFQGLLERDGGVAVHFAAMLFYIYGKAETSFDMDKREFFLKFNTNSTSDRRIVFQELCEKIGVDCRKYMK